MVLTVKTVDNHGRFSTADYKIQFVQMKITCSKRIPS